LNWRLPLFFQPDLCTSFSSHHSHPHPADTARLARHPRLAVLLLTLLREQMDVVAADAFAAFLIALYFIIVRCFTDKFIRRTTRLSSRPFG
jgi:hypothetical protein